jgi:hypothetical protein
MLDFEGLRAVAMMSAGTGRETLSSAMACKPTTDLDEKGAAGDRLGTPADGGRGTVILKPAPHVAFLPQPRENTPGLQLK